MNSILIITSLLIIFSIFSHALIKLGLAYPITQTKPMYKSTYPESDIQYRNENQ